MLTVDTTLETGNTVMRGTLREHSYAIRAGHYANAGIPIANK